VARLFVIGDVLLGVLFVVAAALQHNDPDPLPWMTVYLLAAAACALALARPRAWVPPLGVGLGAAAWAASMIPEALRLGDVTRIAEGMKASEPGIEVTREVLGLAIVAGWMAVLTWRAKRPRSA
jgi:hypothetical protein